MRKLRILIVSDVRLDFKTVLDYNLRRTGYDVSLVNNFDMLDSVCEVYQPDILIGSYLTREQMQYIVENYHLRKPTILVTDREVTYVNYLSKIPQQSFIVILIRPLHILSDKRRMTMDAVEQLAKPIREDLDYFG